VDVCDDGAVPAGEAAGQERGGGIVRALREDGVRLEGAQLARDCAGERERAGEAVGRERQREALVGRAGAAREHAQVELVG
jgi:hypothetical protein